MSGKEEVLAEGKQDKQVVLDVLSIRIDVSQLKINGLFTNASSDNPGIQKIVTTEVHASKVTARNVTEEFRAASSGKQNFDQTIYTG